MTNRSVSSILLPLLNHDGALIMAQPLTPNPDASSTERILSAAETLFAEQGFDAVSMNAIAALAGVSKANIFHHFSSKETLYLTVLQSVCKESAARLDQLESGEGSFIERLHAFAQHHLQSLLQHDQVARLILRDIMEKRANHSLELAEQVFGRHFGRLVDIVHRGQERGELRQDIDPAAVAVMLIAINLYFFQARDILRYLPGIDFAEDPLRYHNKTMQILRLGLLPQHRETP